VVCGACSVTPTAQGQPSPPYPPHPYPYPAPPLASLCFCSTASVPLRGWRRGKPPAKPHCESTLTPLPLSRNTPFFPLFVVAPQSRFAGGAVVNRLRTAGSTLTPYPYPATPLLPCFFMWRLCHANCTGSTLTPLPPLSLLLSRNPPPSSLSSLCSASVPLRRWCCGEPPAEPHHGEERGGDVNQVSEQVEGRKTLRRDVIPVGKGSRRVRPFLLTLAQGRFFLGTSRRGARLGSAKLIKRFTAAKPFAGM